MNFIRPIGSAPNMGMEGNSGHMVLDGVAYSVNGQAIGVFRGRKLSTATLAVVVGAQNVTLVKVGGKNLILGTLAITVAGQNLSMSKQWKVGTAAAVYSVDVQDLTVLCGRLTGLTAAAYAVGGQAVNVLMGRLLSADSPLITINGVAVAFGRNRRLAIATFPVTVNGQALTLARYAKRVQTDQLTVKVKFGEVALYPHPVKSYDVTKIYNKGRGKKRFWQAVRAKEMIDPDF